MPHVTENLIFSAAGNGDVTMTPIPNQRQRRVCLLGDVLIVVALLLIDHSSCQGKLGCSNKKCLLKLACMAVVVFQMVKQLLPTPEERIQTQANF